MKIKAVFILFVLACMAAAVHSEVRPRKWYTSKKLDIPREEDPSIKIYDGQSRGGLLGALKKSREIWESEKKRHNDTYSYTVSFRSWAGFGHRTRVVVRNGVVAEREYSEFERNIKDRVVYTERGDKINSHRKGFKAVTMDAIYDMSHAILKDTDIKKNSLSLELDEGGVLASCAYRPDGCADDCSSGINSLRLQWLDQVQ